MRIHLFFHCILIYIFDLCFNYIPFLYISDSFTTIYTLK